MIGIRDRVGKIHQLRLQSRRPTIEKTISQRAQSFGDFFRATLQHSFTCLKSQIKATKIGVFVLQFVDHAQ